MIVSSCITNVKLIVISFLTVLVIGIAPSGVFAQAPDVKSDVPRKNSNRHIEKVGPLPGMGLFYEKDVGKSSLFAKGSWTFNWAFRPETFKSSWPIYGYQPQAIIEKCRMISDGAKQYKVGFSFLLPTDEKLRDGYFGYPLKASAKSDQWKQLVELASKLPMHFSRDVKPGKIQFVGANYKTKIVDVLDKTTVEKFTKKASTSKFLKMYAKHAQMNADFMSDKKKIYSAFTLDNVCKISEDLVSDKTYEFLIGTRYPVLDVVPAKRFIKGEGFGIHQ